MPNYAKRILRWSLIWSYLCHFQLFVFGQKNLFEALPRKGKFTDYLLLLRTFKTDRSKNSGKFHTYKNNMFINSL